MSVKDFRTNGRIPALSWFNKKLGNVITRSSQPNVGLYGNSSSHDQKLIEMIRLCAPNNSELVIFDARSKLAARGNKFKGFGTEDTTIDYKKCRLYYLNLSNIHAVKLAFDNMWQAIDSPIAVPEISWLSTLQASQWLNLISRLISSGEHSLIILTALPPPIFKRTLQKTNSPQNCLSHRGAWSVDPDSLLRRLGQNHPAHLLGPALARSLLPNL